MIGPARSPTKAPYRAPTKSLALELPAPQPPITIQTYPCVLREAGRQESTPPNPACQVDDPLTYCPGQTPIALIGYGAYLFDLMIPGMDSQLSQECFPADIVDRVTGQVYFTIPRLTCPPQHWGTGVAEVIGQQAYSIWDATNRPIPNVLMQFDICSEVHLPIPAGVSRFSLKACEASYPLTAIDAGTGVLTIGAHSLAVQQAIEIQGQPLNDGRYRITAVDRVGGTVTVAGLQAEAVVPGAKVILVAGIWNQCGDYSAVSLPPQGLYSPRLFYTGPQLGVSNNDYFLRLDNAGVYSGPQGFDPSLTTLDGILIGTSWQGDAPAGGTWVNNGIVLSMAVTPPTDRTRIEVLGNAATYDGIYTEFKADAATNTITIDQLFFSVTDSGFVIYAGLILFVDTWPGGDYSGVTVTVAGTGLYDGTYQNVEAFDLGGGEAALLGGELIDVFWVGDATGTYSIVSPAISGNVTFVDEEYYPDQFNGVAAEKAGGISRIDSRHTRWTVTSHNAAAGFVFTPHDSTVYPATVDLEVDGVGVGYIDVRTPFISTDAGPYGAGQRVS